MQRRNPELADLAILRKHGIDLGEDQDEDPIRNLVRTLRELRQAGLIEDPRKAGEEEWWKEALRAAGQGLGLAVLSAQRGVMPGIVPPPSPGPTPYVEPSPSLPSVAHPPVQPPSTPEVPMSLVSQWVISQLQPLNPEQAAQWLLSQPAPQARQLVELLVRTPDEQLPALLGELATQVPDLAGAIAWLRSRPQWLVDTVHAVRRLSGAQSHAQGQGG